MDNKETKELVQEICVHDWRLKSDVSLGSMWYCTKCRKIERAGLI